jgi:hypothetical protein
MENVWLSVQGKHMDTYLHKHVNIRLLGCLPVQAHTMLIVPQDYALPSVLPIHSLTVQPNIVSILVLEVITLIQC